CRAILRSAIEELARAFPSTSRILRDEEFERAAKHCVGLDGRRIRKLIISACALNKQTAIDPNGLTAADVLEAAVQAQDEAKSLARTNA
ncbi:MAG TPA: hypothetical protein PKC18_21280, partial [Lacipirellulaceae bacterium]|nr:hypothetical protein [Lacipirellulaceae bacterium]